jgi:hypothetical protein
MVEPSQPIDATHYLSTALQTAGYTATFVDDPVAPEPSSLVLLCTGLASVGGFGWMRKRTAKKTAA